MKVKISTYAVSRITPLDFGQMNSVLKDTKRVSLNRTELAFHLLSGAISSIAKVNGFGHKYLENLDKIGEMRKAGIHS